MEHTRRANCITPPYLLEKLMESDDPTIRDAARETLVTTAGLRGQRESGASLAALAAPADGQRSIFDVQHRETMASARIMRTETGPASSDESVNRAFDGLGATRRFYADILGRNSIDGNGLRLDGYVHFGVRFNNAFWNGRQMVFGDGDGKIFSDLTGSLDVIAHELTHGVTEATAGLEYHKQSGALNESMSDVFGSLVKQFVKNQTADQADWLIGDEVFTPRFAGDALRSLKAPGTAFNNPDMGRDRQPAHMRDFVVLSDTAAGDWGGVHINSGIPNKAFYLTATAIGGHAWQAPAHIWYEALKASGPTSDFQEFADTTVAKAEQLFGRGSTEQRAVIDAWSQVGIGVAVSALRLADVGAAVDGSYVEVAAKIEQLSADIAALTKLVRANGSKSAVRQKAKAS